MSRVLFLNGPASGHVNPTLGLVEELVRQGEEVVYASSGEFRHKLERLGAEFAEYENFLAGRASAQLGELMPLVNLILASYEVILPCIFRLAEARTFDYIIHDSMYGCGGIVAKRLGLPHIATCSSFLFAERLQTGGAKGSFAAQLSYMKEFSALAKRVGERFSISPLPQIKDIFFQPGDVNLVFTIKELQPEAESLDDSFRFVGPSIHSRGEALDFRLDKSDGRRIVYISLGTIFNEVKDFYAMCFEALRDFDGQVVVSVGPKTDISAFGRLPGHVIVRPYVPQLAVLEEADLFLTHGGMNSVHEALYYGVSLIVAPMAADQPIVAGRIAELGAGIAVNPSLLTPDELRRCVDEVLQTEAYRSRSRELGSALRRAGGQKAAMEEIARFKLHHGIR